MKLLIPVLLMALTFLFSAATGCTSENPQSSDDATVTATDSTKILSIIAFRDTLLNRAAMRQKNNDLNPSIIEGDNRYDYLTWDNGDAMYHGIFKTDSGEVRVMLFIQNGKLVNINYRVGITKPTRMAKEAFLYYNDNQELEYVEEHSMLLKENEMPSLLINQPYLASTRPLEEWEQEIQPYKKQIISAISAELSKEE